MRDSVDSIRRTENPGRVSQVRWRREDAHGRRIHKDWGVCHLVGNIEEAHANKNTCEKPMNFWNIPHTRRREHPFDPLGLRPMLVPP